MAQHPDMIVIGGGVIGAACALRLARGGLRVTLLERGKTGGEASPAGAGIITPGSFARQDPLALLRRRSVTLYAEWASLIHELSGIDPEFDTVGGLDLIYDANQLAAAEREVQAAIASGAATNPPTAERISPEMARTLEPTLTGDFDGALLRRDISLVDNPRLMEGLLGALGKVGVTVLPQARAMDFVLSNGAVEAISTPTAVLPCGGVLLSGGAWSGSLGTRLGLAELAYPVRGQIVLLRARPGVLTRTIAFGAGYLAPRRDGRILIGSTEEHNAGFDDRPTASAALGLIQTTARFAPGLLEFPIERTWAGLRPGSRDGAPVIGRVPGLKNAFVATGHFRSGLTLAPGTAELIEKIVCENGAEEPAFSPQRISERSESMPVA